jgi:hypothetical protein
MIGYSEFTLMLNLGILATLLSSGVMSGYFSGKRGTLIFSCTRDPANPLFTIPVE